MVEVTRPRVRIHVIGTDGDRRLLLSKSPGTYTWTLPWSYLTSGESPQHVASMTIVRSGRTPEPPVVVSAETATERDMTFLDLTYRCAAARSWGRPLANTTAMWWSLDEISSLTLSPRVHKALVQTWTEVWPDI